MIFSILAAIYIFGGFGFLLVLRNSGGTPDWKFILALIFWPIVFVLSGITLVIDMWKRS